MSTDPHVVDLDGAHAVVVPDWHAHNHMLGMYCGTQKFDDSLPRGQDLYILCHDAGRADEVLELLLKYPFHTAREIAIARLPTYGAIGRRLVDAGYAVACDTLGPDCDDERLKAIHPAPPGPMIDFHWEPRDKSYRMRCLFTGSRGETASQRVVLRHGDGWQDQVDRGYRRFSKKKPPSAMQLTCAPHVAAILSRLDWHGADRFAKWRAAIDNAGVDAHQEVAPFIVSAETVDASGDLVSLELKGARGSYALSSKCTYHGGTSIMDRTLDLKADLPETVALGILGSPASIIWGDADLSKVTVSRRGRQSARSFVLDYEAVPLPTPEPAALDEEKAAADLKAMSLPGDVRIEGVVLALMARLAPSVRLHLYRTLMAMDETRVDISPWLEETQGTMILARDHLVIRHYSSGYYSTTDGISL